MTSSHALDIDFDGSSIFAVHDRATPDDGGRTRSPVLICSPWGWDDVASYRSRRDWARRLAAAGHSTLRFDLPATGNSAGAPGDAPLLELWIAAVDAAARWLTDDSGFGAVSGLGLGLGSLLALAAARRGAPIWGVALWGAPASGRRFLRETKAFSAMQPWNADRGADLGDGVSPGWLEAGGFALAPQTIEELGELTIDPEPGSWPGRVLAFDRDGIAPDPKLLENLVAGGAEVEAASGPGWGEFVSHPERSRLPEEVAARLELWLPDTAAEVGPAAPRPRSADATPAAAPAPAPLRQEILRLDFDRGATVGVLTEPAGERVPGLAAVFLDAGAVRSIGPSRLWTEAARRWAAVGMPSLRVDLEGIGEADGPPAGTLKVGDFYRPHYASQLREILDQAQARGIAERFVLVGLCSGGYWAFRTAVEDPRVAAVFGINSGALRWDDRLLVQRQARTRSRALEPEYWRRLVHGEVGADKVLTMVRSVATSGLYRARTLGDGGRRGLVGGIEVDLDALAAAGTHVLLAFSGREPLDSEIKAQGLEDRGERWPNLEFASLPGEDHTLRSAPAQRALRALLDGELEKVLAAVAATP